MAAAEQVKLRKRLEALLKLPENQICCDCKKRGEYLTSHDCEKLQVYISTLIASYVNLFTSSLREA